MKPILTTRLAAITALLFLPAALPSGACSKDSPPSPTAGTGGGAPGSGGAAGTGGSAGTGGAAGSGGAVPAPDAALASPDARDVVAEIKCTGVTDRNKPIAPAAGRKVYCGFDLGSNNLKLQVISLEEGKPLSFEDERQCRVRTGFGALVFDSATMARSPLKMEPLDQLIATMKEFQRICTLDSGTVVGAEATQWARDATNIADVKAAAKSATGLDIEVLSGEQEGIYGYVAATRNAPEKFSLDPGSNSFQIGWLPKGATEVRTISVPFGYQRGAAMYYPENTTDTYEAARAKHAADLKARIDVELGKLTPPASLSTLKAAVTAGNLKPEIFVLGQDGALHLSVKAQLRDAAGKWLDQQKAYDDRVAMEKPMVNATFGDITTLLMPADLTAFFTTIVKQPDFDALKSAPIRKIYGEKALANAVLLDTLVNELGLTTMVLVPQELPAGYILAKLPK